MNAYCKDAVMRFHISSLLLLICLFCTSGCTTMTALQCLNADWYVDGRTAAARGLPASEVLSQQNACVQHGVVPDRRAFARGWRDAMAEQA